MESQIETLSAYRFETSKEALADYLDFFVASQKEAEKQIKRAEEFNECIAAYLKEKGII